ncbi:Uncharacterised protein [Mycobacteroides abscessus subsp. abscessus]|nr:Uncharacterised protein [Mycobacteroides abscessus subsp. abscessus]
MARGLLDVLAQRREVRRGLDARGELDDRDLHRRLAPVPFLRTVLELHRSHRIGPVTREATGRQ